MADVFISYARNQQATARAAAAALRAAGFEPWIDDQLPTHRNYYDVIEERLKAASAVLVLWSKAAAESQWVRAEADLARSLNKLVQASADGSLPPMPFNQIQCAQLKGWRGAKDNSEWLKVLASIQALAPAETAKPPTRPGKRWRLAAVGVLCAIVAIGLGLALAFHRTGSAQAAQPKFAVLPFRALSGDPAEKAFAADLTADIAGGLSENAMQVVPISVADGGAEDKPLKSSGADYAFMGSVRREGGQLRVRGFLQDVPHGVTIWTMELEQPAAAATQLRRSVAAAAANAAYIVREPLAQPDVRLDPESMALFLKGEFATARTSTALNSAENLQAFESLVVRAPKFGLGHSLLAVALVAASNRAPPAEAAALRDRARREAAIGRRLAPHAASPSYDVLFQLARIETPLDLARAEDIERAGIAAQPDYPFLHMRLCRFLYAVGRMREAVGSCQRAITIRRVGPVAYSFVGALYSAGQRDLARAASEDAHQRFSNHINVRWTRLRIEAFDGDPLRALATLEDPDQRPQTLDENGAAVLRSMLQARRSGSPADASLAASALQGAGSLPSAWRVLGLQALGRTDAAFATIGAMSPNEIQEEGLLLDPALSRLRHDPRFWREASRIGLITYWRTRGIWPDFCTAPGQTFDCKAAAARALPA